MQVTVTIASEEGKFAAGTTAANWRIEAERSPGAAIAFEYEGPDPTTTFDMPEGESFTIRGWRLDIDHNPLGAVASVDFVVGSDLVRIFVASSVAAQSTP